MFVTCSVSRDVLWYRMYVCRMPSLVSRKSTVAVYKHVFAQRAASAKMRMQNARIIKNKEVNRATYRGYRRVHNRLLGNAVNAHINLCHRLATTSDTACQKKKERKTRVESNFEHACQCKYQVSMLNKHPFQAFFAL
jgi:hypothetical protein